MREHIDVLEKLHLPLKAENNSDNLILKTQVFTSLFISNKLFAPQTFS